MRPYIDTKHFTKAERIFSRILRDNHIVFKTKIYVCGREIDFIVNNFAIEIDGHEQDGGKNILLIASGYIPIHFTNEEIYRYRDKLINILF